jgi:hypothetical protein
VYPATGLDQELLLLSADYAHPYHLNKPETDSRAHTCTVDPRCSISIGQKKKGVLKFKST